MSILSTLISNIFNGVSQQAPELRLPSQATKQENALSSPVDGLKKRPGTQHIAQMEATPGNPKVHFINRDTAEQYAIVLDNGSIKAFDAQTGNSIPVATPDGTDYLLTDNPQGDLKLVSVADYTFVVNTRQPVQMTSEITTELDKVKATVDFPIPTTQGTAQDTGNTGGGTPSYWNSYGNYGPGSYSTLDDLYKNPNYGEPEPDTGGGDTGGGTTDPGTGGGTTDPGTGGGTTDPGTGGGTGGTGGTTPPTDPVEPVDPAWVNMPGMSLSYFSEPLPSHVSDGDLIARLQSKGLNDSTYLAVYQPVTEWVVEGGGSSAGDLSRFFGYGTNVGYHMGTLQNTITQRLIAEGYTVYFDYNVGGTLYETFPRLLIEHGDDELFYGQANILNRTNSVTSPPINGYYGLSLTGLAISCQLVYIVRKDGVDSVERLRVRLRMAGVIDSVMSSDGAYPNIICGRPENRYGRGKSLYDPHTLSFSTPIDGWSLEYRRFLSTSFTTYNEGVSVSKRTNFKLLTACQVSATWPKAYKVLPRASFSVSGAHYPDEVYTLNSSGKLVKQTLSSLPQ